jgi:hypothetical protein
MIKKGIKAKASVSAIIMLADYVTCPTLLTARFTAEVVEDCKKQLLAKIKRQAETLTIKDIIFEEINIPDMKDIKIKV